MGGFTHANAVWSGETLEHISSFDFTSSYPYVMLSEKFPMSKAEKIEIKNEEELQYNIKRYCCIFQIEIWGLESTQYYENYISVSHCKELSNYVDNNGRVVQAEHLITTITEQDYLIMKKLYAWKSMEIKYCYRFVKDYLPTNFVKGILKLYKDKTELKGIEGKEVEYLSSKEQINASYGMTVTDICRDEIVYDEEDKWNETKPDIEKCISKYNKSVKRFLYYPWGIWVTAYARRNLFSGIVEFKDDYVYSDTDSIKVMNVSNHLDYIKKYNARVMEKLKKAMDYHGLNIEDTRPKNKHGEEKQIGIWDYEGEYELFKTLGAKRYITYKDGKYSITVSGVNKNVAVPYLVSRYGKGIFDAFDNELEIPKEYTGKLTHTYIDEPIKGCLTDYTGITDKYEELSCVHLEQASYSMSISQKYVNYLFGIKEYKR